MPAMAGGADLARGGRRGRALTRDWRGGGRGRLGLLADFPDISGGNSA